MFLLNCHRLSAIILIVQDTMVRTEHHNQEVNTKTNTAGLGMKIRKHTNTNSNNR